MERAKTFCKLFMNDRGKKISGHAVRLFVQFKPKVYLLSKR